MTDLIEIGKRARETALELASVPEERQQLALFHVAEALLGRCPEILSENSRDMENGRRNGMSEGLLDRLLLTEARISAMASAVRSIAAIPSPVGEVISEDVRPNGLKIIKRRASIGVIGIIYESRPNVTSDAFALCFRSGNAVILKGGSDALYSNRAITRVLREALSESGVPADAVQLIESTEHEVTREFMRMNQYVDVLIPRGSKRLIRAVVENASVPVLETGAGNCHIYLDESADLQKAVSIVFNAKTQRIGVCNACESLVVHRSALPLLPLVVKKLQEKQVSVYADAESFLYLQKHIEKTERKEAVGASSLDNAAALSPELIFPAEESDFGEEYLDYKLSVKTVDSLEEAIRHINTYSTKHSESIITEKAENAEKFFRSIDSACVYWNASTRFTDGGEFGFGAEIGISTSKLHARGPMGLRELTTTKYEIHGNGQIR